MASRKTSATLLFAMCLISTSAAFGDDAVKVESTTESSATKTTVTTPIGADTSTTTKTESTETKNTTETAASTSKPTDPTALLYAESVATGPYEAKRKLLLASIKLAKKQGFGITSYLGELSRIEDQIKQGNSGPQLEARIDSIADGLQDQLKRSQILKTQRPPSGGGSFHSSSSSTSASSAGGARSGRSTDQMINELRQKYGDKIPAGMSGLDNADLKEKLMKSDVAKEYLKKMQGGQ